VNTYLNYLLQNRRVAEAKRWQSAYNLVGNVLNMKANIRPTKRSELPQWWEPVWRERA
jgi:hypothetical protein